jgi:hypothetical protein
LNCSVDENRTLTVECVSVGGDIDKDEVACIYDEEFDSPEKC